MFGYLPRHSEKLWKARQNTHQRIFLFKFNALQTPSNFGTNSNTNATNQGPIELSARSVWTHDPSNFRKTRYRRRYSSIGWYQALETQRCFGPSSPPNPNAGPQYLGLSALAFSTENYTEQCTFPTTGLEAKA